MATPVPSATRLECSAAKRQRQEGIVGRLGRPDAVQAGGLGRTDPVRHPRQLGTQARVDLHRALVVTAVRPPSTGAGVGAGPWTAGVSTESDSGMPTCTKRPAAGCS